jgi:peroxiredoxin
MENGMTNFIEGDFAPEFTLPGLNGKEHSLTSILRLGPAVLAFFKISCPVCQFTFPFLQRLHERYGDRQAQIIGISQDNARDTREFNKDHGVSFETLLDEHPYAVSNAYGLTNVPTILLIESDRRIRVSCMGFSKEDLERIANEIAARANLQPSVLFRVDEAVPAYKPG